MLVDVIEIHFLALRYVLEPLGIGDPDLERVEEIAVFLGQPKLFAGVIEYVGQGVYLPGDVFDAAAAMVHRVHAGHDRQEDLGSADVRGGLLPLDVLLPGLEGHSQGPVAVRVNGDANDPSGDESLVFVHCREVGRVRPSESERNAESLGRAHRHIRPHLGRGFQDGQAQKVCRNDDLAFLCVRSLDELRVVEDLPVACRVLHDAAKAAVVDLHAFVISKDKLDPKGFCAGDEYVSCLGQDMV